MMDLADKRVSVVGLGRSGLAVCRFCRERGAEVLGVDDLPREKFDVETARDLIARGVELHFGEQPEDRLVARDLLVVSPGVPPSDAVARAEEAGVPVVAEVEVASWFVDAPIVGITGTNGKSTVTALTGEILAATGRPTFVGGNFGTPLIEAVGTAAAGSGGFLVVELSSFQLERIETFRPRVAVLLNLSEDHLDRYPDMDAYLAAKGRIFIAQQEEDDVVVDGDDPRAGALADRGRAEVHAFGRAVGEVHVDGNALVDEGANDGLRRYPLSLLNIVGEHNKSNACAAILASRLLGADHEATCRGISSFRGLPHRMELVGERDDVLFYNDSKATNVGATVAALEGLDRPVVLIAGGRDKGGDYEPLRELLKSKVREVVLIGEASDVIERALRGATKFTRAADMAAATARAAEVARSGDAVLMAPACSSFDMYRNYVERGEDFRQVAQRLTSSTPTGSREE